MAYCLDENSKKEAVIIKPISFIATRYTFYSTMKSILSNINS